MRKINPESVKIFTLFLAFFFVISCRDELEFTGAPASREALRIVTINVWSGLNYKGNLRMGEYESEEVREKRYRALVAQLKDLDADIIGINEANKLPDYAKKLAADLGYDVFYHVGLGGVRLGKVGLPWNLREGDAILTKKDLYGEFVGRDQLSGAQVGNFFTFHFSDASQIIAVKVTNRGKLLYVFATHWHASLLDNDELRARAHELIEQGKATKGEFEEVQAGIDEGKKWRLKESEKSIEFIKKIAGSEPFVFIGDFNAPPDSKEIRSLLDYGMSDAFRETNPDRPGFTWYPDANLNIQKHYLNKPPGDFEEIELYEELKRLHEAAPKRIDYIFLRANSEISVKSSRVVLNEVIAGVHASDHFGVLAEIKFME